MRVFREETFTPVAAVCAWEDEDAVIAAANDTEYGLAAYVYTHDVRRIYKFMRGLDYGMVSVNTIKMTGAPVPFGGIKQSGLGREGGHYWTDPPGFAPRYARPPRRSGRIPQWMHRPSPAPEWSESRRRIGAKTP